MIILDVLEHLVNPRFLKTLVNNFEKNGAIIFSLPNIQHWTAIKNLLVGVWPQRERGLFDSTHLRFFTKNSIYLLASHACLKVNVISRKYRLVDLPHAPINKFSKLMKYVPLKNFFTYQYIGVLRNK